MVLYFSKGLRNRWEHLYISDPLVHQPGESISRDINLTAGIRGVLYIFGAMRWVSVGVSDSRSENDHTAPLLPFRLNNCFRYHIGLLLISFHRPLKITLGYESSMRDERSASVFVCVCVCKYLPMKAPSPTLRGRFWTLAWTCFYGLKQYGEKKREEESTKCRQHAGGRIRHEASGERRLHAACVIESEVSSLTRRSSSLTLSLTFWPQCHVLLRSTSSPTSLLTTIRSLLKFNKKNETCIWFNVVGCCLVGCCLVGWLVVVWLVVGWLVVGLLVGCWLGSWLVGCLEYTLLLIPKGKLVLCI